MKISRENSEMSEEVKKLLIKKGWTPPPPYEPENTEEDMFNLIRKIIDRSIYWDKFKGYQKEMGLLYFILEHNYIEMSLPRQTGKTNVIKKLWDYYGSMDCFIFTRNYDTKKRFCRELSISDHHPHVINKSNKRWMIDLKQLPLGDSKKPFIFILDEGVFDILDIEELVLQTMVNGKVPPFLVTLKTRMEPEIDPRDYDALQKYNINLEKQISLLQGNFGVSSNGRVFR